MTIDYFPLAETVRHGVVEFLDEGGLDAVGTRLLHQVVPPIVVGGGYQRHGRVLGKACAYLQGRELFVFDGYAGADPEHRLPVRVINELASQNLFIHQLLVRPSQAELQAFQPGFTVITVPGFLCQPELDGVHSEAAIMISFTRRLVLIAGSRYAGEIKKSIFSVMNYILPKQGVFSMHCSANQGPDGDTAIFFGLSGTGKTTLSADPSRRLIGDDEHGWSEKGVFNIEGGCYAKCIHLSKENEPQIWDAIRFGSLVENVVMDPATRELDFDSAALTENTRVGYPVEFIPDCVIPGMGGHPKTVIFLTADAFGVLPPISRLSREQAMYHYVSGYTAKVAGTERGIVEPQATFSTCFGAPFLPLHPSVYAEMLGQRIDANQTNVYLVNTGWAGGRYGSERSFRMKLRYTRAMVTAALNGELENCSYTEDPIFGLHYPKTCLGVPDEFLDQRALWQDDAAYKAAASELAENFRRNFEKYSNMPEAIIQAGPRR